MHKLHDLSEIEDAPTPTVSEHSDYSIKRKRPSIQSDDVSEEDLRSQVKRLRDENSDLRQMWERQRNDIIAIRNELKQLAQFRSWPPDIATK